MWPFFGGWIFCLSGQIEQLLRANFVSLEADSCLLGVDCVSPELEADSVSLWVDPRSLRSQALFFSECAERKSRDGRDST